MPALSTQKNGAKYATVSLDEKPSTGQRIKKTVLVRTNQAGTQRKGLPRTSHSLVMYYPPRGSAWKNSESRQYNDSHHKTRHSHPGSRPESRHINQF